jgi:hypothetical protein
MMSGPGRSSTRRLREQAARQALVMRKADYDASGPGLSITAVSRVGAHGGRHGDREQAGVRRSAAAHIRRGEPRKDIWPSSLARARSV